MTVVAFWPCLNNQFVNWDDPQFVVGNPLIREINLPKIVSSIEGGSYQPLTVLSWSLDYAVAGLKPFVYHAHSVLLHVANVVLVFWLVSLLSGQWLIAFWTALLFGIHPMHVESVAWVTERKDVLYTLFYLAGLISYVYHLRAKSWCWLLSVVFLLLALLSKMQAATFPVTLLLIHWFEHKPLRFKTQWPFWLMAGLFFALGCYLASLSKALVLPQVWDDKIYGALFSVTLYIAKLIYPWSLSALYPHPQGSLGVWVYALIFVLAALVYGLWRLRQSSKIFLFAILFFMIHVALTLPVVTFGQSFNADRYMYLASIGFFWPLGYLLLRWRWLAVVYVALLMLIAYQRCPVWHDGNSLWSDVIKKFPQMSEGYLYRGQYFETQGDMPKAFENYDQCLKVNPQDSRCYLNRGNMYQVVGMSTQAIADYTHALDLGNKELGIYVNRANAYAHVGQNELAEMDYGKAIAANPYFATAYYNRALTRHKSGDSAGAQADCAKARHLGLQALECPSYEPRH